jgi:hypothetical protein
MSASSRDRFFPERNRSTAWRMDIHFMIHAHPSCARFADSSVTAADLFVGDVSSRNPEIRSASAGGSAFPRAPGIVHHHHRPFAETVSLKRQAG